MSNTTVTSSRKGRPRRRRGPPPHPLLPGGAGYSIYGPIHVGINESGRDVLVTLMYRNLLIGGEPGAGKSSLVNVIVAHGAVSPDCELWLFDGKRVELGLWRTVAHKFVGNDITEAIAALTELQHEMDIRYLQLEAVRRRKIVARDTIKVVLAVFDELAYFTAIAGTSEQQELFMRLLLDLIQRGRAVGVIVVAATQRPSADIVPTKIRDIMGFRVAFRCTTDSSSDIILANGWAAEGYSARSVLPESLGVGYILEEGGVPLRFKAAYLTDHDIDALVEVATQLRATHTDTDINVSSGGYGHLVAV
jgi:DNA segregation ATPase FtsK/SpoIIIE, S-DNA-T family